LFIYTISITIIHNGVLREQRHRTVERRMMDSTVFFQSNSDRLTPIFPSDNELTSTSVNEGCNFLISLLFIYELWTLNY